MAEISNEAMEARRAAHTQAFEAVWRRLAPTMPVQAYLEVMKSFHDSYIFSMEATDRGARIIGAEESKTLPDNSATFERMSYRYNGAEAAQAMLAGRVPVMFAAWHHGAIHHLNYGIARLFPQTAFFTRWTYQLGRVFSFPMQGHGAVTLMRMDRFLREGRQVSIFVDGPAFGNVVRLPCLGLSSTFAIGPMHVIRAISDARIVPVTHFLRDESVVDITFHPPLTEFGNRSEPDIIASLLSLFEDNLRRSAPEQVLPQFLVYREALAQKEQSEPSVNRLQAET